MITQTAIRNEAREMLKLNGFQKFVISKFKNYTVKIRTEITSVNKKQY